MKFVSAGFAGITIMVRHTKPPEYHKWIEEVIDRIEFYYGNQNFRQVRNLYNHMREETWPG